MRHWATEIRAIDPASGEMVKWSGPSVPGITFADAEQYCQDNGLGYCKVVGELVAEIPLESDKGTIDYDIIQSN